MRFIFVLCVVAATTFFIYSCAKDGAEKASTVHVENRKMISQVDLLESLKAVDPEINVSFSPAIPNPLSSDCFKQPDPGQICATTSITNFPVNLPSRAFVAPIGTRPVCTLKTSFDVLLCVNPDGTYQFTFSNFSTDWSNCPAFMSWFNALSNFDKGDQMSIWEYEASLDAELIYINIVGQPLPTLCPTPIISSQFVSENCYNRCLTLLDGPPYYRLVKSYCGNQCCIRKNKGCKNISGFITFFDPPTFETKGQPCDISPAVCKFNSIPLNQSCGQTCGPK